jgi:hypothetical protein
MAELERQASISESPGSKLASAEEPTRRSFTSSALTSLLPIAAASGIVQLNYDTPKISFYSPSGRLIQSEGSSSPETHAVHCGSPSVRRSNFSNPAQHSARQNLTATGYLPPVRPALLPMTTPPVPTAPLPAHLRYHHNYRHPERSHIESCESFIESSPLATECGGVVRTNSFLLRSGTRQSPPRKKNASSKDKRHRSTKTLLHDLMGDVSFYKSRYIALAAQSCASFQKSKEKGKTLRKRDTAADKRCPSHSTNKPRQHSRRTARRDEPRQSAGESLLGPLAGHILRICFCQPFDGVGKPSRADAPCATHHVDSKQATRKKQGDRQAENEGAARPVVYKRTTSRRSKTSSSVRPKEHMRGDSAMSVGVGRSVVAGGG